MFKKITFIVIFLIIIVSIGYLLFYFSSRPAELSERENITFDPRNCTYMIDEKVIVLKNGYSEEIIPGSSAKLITKYFGNTVSGDFNGDGLTDEAFLLTQESGGSGVFYYVAVALRVQNGPSGLNAIFLGDRIAPQTTNFQDNEIIVNYADRQSGEPMTTSPSVGISRYFKVDSDRLVEIKK
ncbi:MAG: hypothetical protein PHV78_02020 [Patescibacteria group bacterium]|nr:hypothetical protein [Patescibacteria group bacterium]MDD5121075.1 hypothetical protein [Patescibacteria group bacterium]MDD5221563.1 hypothetical protein [Patescibacteria group bacterium]MDD5396006.1 hypothetical protein [Patescibacteria group bacterium]